MPTIRLVINEERTQELREAGFVHVTGLHLYNTPGEELQTIQPYRSNLGQYGQNNGKIVAITEDGEVWLRGGGWTNVENVIRRYCPRGGGAFVPCTNGESVGMGALLERVADPFDTHAGDPIPKIKH